MKRAIFIVLTLLVIACSSIYATLYDPNKSITFRDDLPFDDLLVPVLDKGGNQKRDKEQNKLYNYHKYINEILKANSITIDKNNSRLIEGYKNESGDGYSFMPDSTISRGEFIKMAISLANNRGFDYSIFPIPANIKGHWAAPYVVVAQMQDVLNEGDITLSNIDEPITRLEVIRILSKIQINMKTIPQYVDGILPNYTDISNLSEEDRAYLLHAAKYDLLENMLKQDGGELKIYPDKNITRAEAARAVLRVY